MCLRDLCTVFSALNVLPTARQLAGSFLSFSWNVTCVETPSQLLMQSGHLNSPHGSRHTLPPVDLFVYHLVLLPAPLVGELWFSSR